MSSSFPRPATLVAAALLPLLSAACSPRAVAPPAAPIAAAERPAAPAPPRVVSATATVTAIDGPRAMLFLDQAPVAEMDWPAMSIGYAALGSAMAGLEVGDRIAFDLDLTRGGYVLATRKLG